MYNDAGLKLLSFGELLRLELVGELLDDPAKMDTLAELATAEKARQEELEAAAAAEGNDAQAGWESKRRARRRLLCADGLK